MILGIAFLLMVSLVTGAGIAALGKWWGGWFSGWEVLAQIINAVIGFLMTTAVFALIYKLMPRVKVGWGDVWVGAAVTAVLFTVGRVLISLYIGKTGIASGFGAAGSVAVIFVWVYYSAQIFLVGAEFTWVYAQRMGSQRKLQNPTADKTQSASHFPQLSAGHPSPAATQTDKNPATGSANVADASAQAVAPMKTQPNGPRLALMGLATGAALALIVRTGLRTRSRSPH